MPTDPEAKPILLMLSWMTPTVKQPVPSGVPFPPPFRIPTPSDYGSSPLLFEPRSRAGFAAPAAHSPTTECAPADSQPPCFGRRGATPSRSGPCSQPHAPRRQTPHAPPSPTTSDESLPVSPPFRIPTPSDYGSSPLLFEPRSRAGFAAPAAHSPTTECAPADSQPPCFGRRGATPSRSGPCSQPHAPRRQTPHAPPSPTTSDESLPVSPPFRIPTPSDYGSSPLLFEPRSRAGFAAPAAHSPTTECAPADSQPPCFGRRGATPSRSGPCSQPHAPRRQTPHAPPSPTTSDESLPVSPPFRIPTPSDYGSSPLLFEPRSRAGFAAPAAHSPTTECAPADSQPPCFGRRGATPSRSGPCSQPHAPRRQTPHAPPSPTTSDESLPVSPPFRIPTPSDYGSSPLLFEPRSRAGFAAPAAHSPTTECAPADSQPPCFGRRGATPSRSGPCSQPHAPRRQTPHAPPSPTTSDESLPVSPPFRIPTPSDYGSSPLLFEPRSRAGFAAPAAHSPTTECAPADSQPPCFGRRGATPSRSGPCSQPHAPRRQTPHAPPSPTTSDESLPVSPPFRIPTPSDYGSSPLLFEPRSRAGFAAPAAHSPTTECAPADSQPPCFGRRGATPSRSGPCSQPHAPRRQTPHAPPSPTTSDESLPVSPPFRIPTPSDYGSSPLLFEPRSRAGFAAPAAHSPTTECAPADSQPPCFGRRGATPSRSGPCSQPHAPRRQTPHAPPSPTTSDESLPVSPPFRIPTPSDYGSSPLLFEPRSRAGFAAPAAHSPTTECAPADSQPPCFGRRGATPSRSGPCSQPHAPRRQTPHAPPSPTTSDESLPVSPPFRIPTPSDYGSSPLLFEPRSRAGFAAPAAHSPTTECAPADSQPPCFGRRGATPSRSGPCSQPHAPRRQTPHAPPSPTTSDESLPVSPPFRIPTPSDYGSSPLLFEPRSRAGFAAPAAHSPTTECAPADSQPPCFGRRGATPSRSGPCSQPHAPRRQTPHAPPSPTTSDESLPVSPPFRIPTPSDYGSSPLLFEPRSRAGFAAPAAHSPTTECAPADSQPPCFGRRGATPSRSGPCSQPHAPRRQTPHAPPSPTTSDESLPVSPPFRIPTPSDYGSSPLLFEPRSRAGFAAPAAHSPTTECAPADSQPPCFGRRGATPSRSGPCSQPHAPRRQTPHAPPSPTTSDESLPVSPPFRIPTPSDYGSSPLLFEPRSRAGFAAPAAHSPTTECAPADSQPPCFGRRGATPSRSGPCSQPHAPRRQTPHAPPSPTTSDESLPVSPPFRIPTPSDYGSSPLLFEPRSRAGFAAPAAHSPTTECAPADSQPPCFGRRGATPSRSGPCSQPHAPRRQTPHAPPSPTTSDESLPVSPPFRIPTPSDYGSSPLLFEPRSRAGFAAPAAHSPTTECAPADSQPPCFGRRGATPSRSGPCSQPHAPRRQTPHAPPSPTTSDESLPVSPPFRIPTPSDYGSSPLLFEPRSRAGFAAPAAHSPTTECAPADSQPPCFGRRGATPSRSGPCSQPHAPRRQTPHAPPSPTTSDESLPVSPPFRIPTPSDYGSSPLLFEPRSRAGFAAPAAHSPTTECAPADSQPPCFGRRGATPSRSGPCSQPHAPRRQTPHAPPSPTTSDESLPVSPPFRIPTPSDYGSSPLLFEPRSRAGFAAPAAHSPTTECAPADSQPPCFGRRGATPSRSGPCSQPHAPRRQTPHAPPSPTTSDESLPVSPPFRIPTPSDYGSSPLLFEPRSRAGFAAPAAHSPTTECAPADSQPPCFGRRGATPSRSGPCSQPHAPRRQTPHAPPSPTTSDESLPVSPPFRIPTPSDYGSSPLLFEPRSRAGFAAPAAHSPTTECAPADSQPPCFGRRGATPSRSGPCSQPHAPRRQTPHAPPSPTTSDESLPVSPPFRIPTPSDYGSSPLLFEPRSRAGFAAPAAHSPTTECAPADSQPPCFGRRGATPSRSGPCSQPHAPRRQTPHAPPSPTTSDESLPVSPSFRIPTPSDYGSSPLLFEPRSRAGFAAPAAHSPTTECAPADSQPPCFGRRGATPSRSGPCSQPHAPRRQTPHAPPSPTTSDESLPVSPPFRIPTPSDYGSSPLLFEPRSRAGFAAPAAHSPTTECAPADSQPPCFGRRGATPSRSGPCSQPHAPRRQTPHAPPSPTTSDESLPVSPPFRIPTPSDYGSSPLLFEPRSRAGFAAPAAHSPTTEYAVVGYRLERRVC
ncbi:hypothetical protein P3T76_007183 [Phytophthora citrophthora]|uniref:Uncharacterized protein n=1 Tax=Phytophthora citrophthora TaxID=4793 RepID=A0AAD9LN00_9STRA|nr:hypothetical protein P3T76_007183 [Phytophthora citrophthora]